MTSWGALGLLLGCSWCLLGSPGNALGCLGVLLGTLGVLLGLFLKTYMEKRVPLGALGMRLGSPGDVLRPFGVLLDCSLGAVGALWGHLGVLSGCLGCILGALGLSWGGVGVVLGCFGSVMGHLVHAWSVYTCTRARLSRCTRARTRATFENLYGEEGPLECSWVPKRENH